MKKPIRTILSLAVTALMVAGVANAGSFSLYTESSAAALGNYAAGIAAEAADASIGWYNPAGLVILQDQQLVLGAVRVFPTSKLTGTSTFLTENPFFPFGPPLLPPYEQSFNSIEGAEDAVVPSFHYARPLGENAAFGLSVVSPFGLSTDWGNLGPVRYQATRSQLMTTNLSPELGGKLSENFSVGAGIDLQYAHVKFNQILGSPALLQLTSPITGEPATFWDSTSDNTGSSIGVGFHAGVLVMFNDNHTRLGGNYQSEVKHKFNGRSRLQGALADPLLIDQSAIFLSKNLSSNDIDLPAVVTLSGYHEVNERLALLASAVYTGWHSLKTIQLYNIAAFNPVTVEPALVNSVSTEYYNDSWRGAVGINYRVNPQWMLRAGGGYDQTPTNDQNRDVRIPDSDRWALSVGTHYQPRSNIGFDLGYTHLFTTENARVNKTTALGTSTYNVNATATSSVDLVGLQFIWLIDPVEKASNMKK